MGRDRHFTFQSEDRCLFSRATTIMRCCFLCVKGCHRCDPVTQMGSSASSRKEDTCPQALHTRDPALWKKKIFFFSPKSPKYGDLLGTLLRLPIKGQPVEAVGEG